jgi:hypothetical protein
MTDPTPSKQASTFFRAAIGDLNFLKGFVAGVLLLVGGIVWTILFSFEEDPRDLTPVLSRIIGPAMTVGALIILVIGIRVRMCESGKRAEERLWRE